MLLERSGTLVLTRANPLVQRSTSHKSLFLYLMYMLHKVQIKRACKTNHTGQLHAVKMALGSGIASYTGNIAINSQKTVSKDKINSAYLWMGSPREGNFGVNLKTRKWRHQNHSRTVPSVQHPPLWPEPRLCSGIFYRIIRKTCT
jgi:hypothetical protein